MEPSTYNRECADLLLNELEMAILFLNVALTARDSSTRERDLKNAEEAYANATKMLSEPVMYSQEDWRKIEELTSEFRVRRHSAR